MITDKDPAGKNEVLLRPWNADDLTALVQMADNRNIAANMRDLFPHPYTEQDGLFFIKKVLGDDPAKVLAIECNGRLAGAIGIFPQDDIYRNNAELGYWIGEPFWGKGIASEAVRLMIGYAFNTFPVSRIYAVPFGRNIASQRVLEKNGFRLQARLDGVLVKFGQIEDELIYGLWKTDLQ